jgi:hypothetical protein
MTPEERQRDRLRHFPTLLERWRGGRARLWDLSVSHECLTIRVEQPGVRGNLEIGCIGVTHIHSPFRWDNSHIEIVLTVDNTFVITDEGAGVRVVAMGVEIAENRKPLDLPVT